MQSPSPTDGTATTTAAIRSLTVESLRPHPDNPRLDLDTDACDELRESIARDGFLASEPIVARPCSGEGYEIISGHRRLKAAMALGLTTVPVVVTPLNDDEARERLGLHNSGKPLGTLELGILALKVDPAAGKVGTGLARFARRIGVQPQNLSRYRAGAVLFKAIGSNIDIRAVRHLGDHLGRLARAPESEWLELASRCVSEGWTVRECEQAARQARSRGTASARPPGEPRGLASNHDDDAQLDRTDSRIKAPDEPEGSSSSGPHPQARRRRREPKEDQDQPNSSEIAHVASLLTQAGTALAALRGLGLGMIPGNPLFEFLRDDDSHDTAAFASELVCRRDATILVDLMPDGHPFRMRLESVACGRSKADPEFMREATRLAHS